MTTFNPHDDEAQSLAAGRDAYRDLMAILVDPDEESEDD